MKIPQLLKNKILIYQKNEQTTMFFVDARATMVLSHTEDQLSFT